MSQVIRGAGIPHTELGKADRIIRACRRELPIVKKYLPRKARVLDWGCGSGEFAHVLKRNGYEVSGYEPVHVSADAARKDYGIEVTEVIPLVAQWDGITCMEVLQYVPDVGNEIFDIGRCLLPGGHLFISQVNKRSPWRFVVSVPSNEIYDLARVYPTPGPEYLVEVERFCGEDFLGTRDRGIRRLLKQGASLLDTLARLVGWRISLFEIVVYQKKLL